VFRSVPARPPPRPSPRRQPHLRYRAVTHWARIGPRRILGGGVELTHAAVSPLPPNPSYSIVARTEGYTHAATVWDVVPRSRAHFPSPRAQRSVTIRHFPHLAVRHGHGDAPPTSTCSAPAAPAASASAMTAATLATCVSRWYERCVWKSWKPQPSWRPAAWITVCCTMRSFAS
jgi:hypothetical protein